MNAPLTAREIANLNPPGACAHGRTGHCTICEYEFPTHNDAAPAVNEVPC